MKLRMHIGANELELDGPVAAVREMLGEWKRLIGAQPTAPVAVSGTEPKNVLDPALAALVAFDPQEKLFRLRQLPDGKWRNPESALLLLHAFEAHNGDAQAGVVRDHLLAAMQASGLNFERLDRVLARYICNGLINKSGQRANERYMLSATGRQRATRLARIMAARHAS